MNLDFGILWIEDSFSTEEEESLKRRVLEAGFVARIESVPNGQKIGELSRVHNLYHRYDIILLDYKLLDESGNELAPRIRQLFPSTTIMFYSGSASEQQLRKMIADREVEGVYCSARDRFIERTGALIDQTARSLDRLSGMRGLAMRVVAECDELMKAAMLSISTRDPNCAQEIGELDAAVSQFYEDCRQKYEDAQTGDLNTRLATRMVDSAKLFDHFRRLTKIVARNPEALGLTPEAVERVRVLRRQSSRYTEEVLQKRNVLAHVTEEKGPDGWILRGNREISTRDFPEIRRAFAGHINAFRDLHDLLTPLDSQQLT